MKNRLKCLFGFTLAEVLITLGIIGIVAALTIPQLVQNFQDQEFRGIFKKDYALLSSAISQANYEFDGMLRPENTFYSPISFNEKMKNISLQNGHQINQLFMDKYLPVVMHCSQWGPGGTGYQGEWKIVSSADTGNDCWAGDYGYSGIMGLNGAKIPNGVLLLFSAGWRTVILNNGSSITFEPGPIATTGSSWGNIAIDVNNLAGPNIVGKDRFVTTLIDRPDHYAKLVPFDANPIAACDGNSKATANTGLGCAAKAIMN